MRAVELESAVAIMNEQELVPHGRAMALLTAHCPFFPKLAAMNILMAISAAGIQGPVAQKICWQTAICHRQLHRDRRLDQIRPGILARMAFTALDFLMRADQREAR